jgi:hypothetical protein
MSKIYSKHDELPFGKHKGRLIIDILNNELSYAQWLVRERIIEMDNETFEIYKSNCEGEGVEP